MATKLQKLEAQRIYARNHELAKSDPFANYVYKMNQAGVTTDGKASPDAQTHVIDFLQTNLPLSKEWKEAVNAKVDKLLKPVDEFLGTKGLTTCSSTAFIARCSPDEFTATPTAGAETDLLATFIAAAYEIKDISKTPAAKLDANTLITESLIPVDKKYDVALNTASTGSAVKDAVKDQATAKALAAVPEIGNVIVDNAGAIQAEGTAEGNTAKKLSTLAKDDTITPYTQTTGCDFSANIANCAYVIKAGIWNYLNDGKGGTGADGGAKAGIAGAKQIHDYLEKVQLADKAQSKEDKNINDVADSRISEAFAKVAEVHKNGDATPCDTSSKTIKEGKAECKFKADEIKDNYGETKPTEKAAAVKASIDLAGKDYLDKVAGTKVEDAVIAKSTGTAPNVILGYDNAVGAKVQSNTPALLNTIVKNYVAGVVGASGWTTPSPITNDHKAFAKVYNDYALNLCGSPIGDGESFDIEVKSCMTAYYKYVGAVTAACTAKSDKISDECAAGFAGSFMTAYKDGFDSDGVCHLNAISEPQGDYHYDL